MALIIAGASVATGMSDVADSVLRSDNIMIPNVTYTDKFQVGTAGQIQVSRYNGGGIEAPKVPGSKFVGTNYTNDLVTINCNNSFQKEKDVFGVVAASMPVDVLTDATINVSEDTREDREATALAVLVAEGTVDSVKTAITKDNVKEILIGSRKVLRKKHAKPNIVLCSVDTYSAVLEAAGKDFTPMINDEIQLTGKIGIWLGMVFIEATRLDGTSNYFYINGEGTVVEQPVDNVDYIMYDYNAFSIIDKLVALRAVDSEEFVGAKVQSEIDAGLKVTNSDCVLIKKTAFVVTVTLNDGDGTATPTSITITDGVASAALPTAVLAGHTFDGWFTSAVGGVQKVDADLLPLLNDITLYAHYTAV